MVLKSLPIIFKFGQILALTPSLNASRLSFCQKLYSAIFILFITICLGITIYFKKFYRDYNYVKVAVSALYDFSLLLFNYLAVGAVFYKEKQWRYMIANMKIILGKVEKASRVSSLTVVFVVSEVVEVAIITMSLNAWLDIYGMWYFERYSIQCFQLLLLFTYVNFLCLFINIILRMYKRVENALRGILAEDSKSFYHTVKKLDQWICFLKDTVDSFNAVFAWPVAFLIFYTSIHILNDSYSVFVKTSSYKKGSVFMELFADVSVVLLVFVATTTFILRCDSVLAKAEEILLLSYRLRRKFRSSGPQIKEELYELSNTIIENYPRFSAARFFDVKRSVILSMLGSITTYLIIMIQFQLGRY